jgi:hypothetical protein
MERDTYNPQCYAEKKMKNEMRKLHIYSFPKFNTDDIFSLPIYNGSNENKCTKREASSRRTQSE